MTAAQTYDAFLKRLGITEGAKAKLPDYAESAFRDTYEWSKGHPDADRGDLMEHVGHVLNPGGDDGHGIVPSWIYNPAKKIVEFVDPARALGRDPLHPPLFGPGGGGARQPSGPSGPSGATGAAPPPTDEQAKADASSAIGKLKGSNPALEAALQAALAGGAGGTVSLWGNLGVDPNAPVHGAQFHRSSGAFGRYPSWAGKNVPLTQSADSWLKGLYTMAPQDLAELQHRMWEAGWYEGTKATDPSLVQWGRPDASTLEAYGMVLGETARYNAAGRAKFGIDDVIGLGSPLKGTAAAGSGQPFSRTSPADLTAALRSEAQQSIGRDLSPEEEARFAASYRSDEEAAARQSIAAGAANRTEGVSGPGSPSAEAAGFIDANNAADKLAYGAAVRQAAFFGMLKSPV